MSAESTAVRITAFIRVPPPGMWSWRRTLAYGCSMAVVFQGMSVTTTKIEPM